MCRSRRFAAKFPIKHAFAALKKNAKRRGKLFALTLEEFTQVALKTGYMDGRGRAAGSLSIDRIENDVGYTLDNIRVTLVSENAAKHARKAYVPYFHGLSDSDKEPEAPDERDQPWLELPMCGPNEPF